MGAGIVKLELVEQNASVARAMTMGANLINNLLMFGDMVLTVFAARAAGPLAFRFRLSARGPVRSFSLGRRVPPR